MDYERLAQEAAEYAAPILAAFKSKSDSYYTKPLFFLTPILHRCRPLTFNFSTFPMSDPSPHPTPRLMPETMRQVILLDVDLQFARDIAELHAEFARFSGPAVMGLAHEQQPVYFHILSDYRRAHPESKAGLPATQGGQPGFNSGVVLLDLARMRASAAWQDLLAAPDAIVELSAKFNFRGHLGDQDLYSLISLEHPEVWGGGYY